MSNTTITKVDNDGWTYLKKIRTDCKCGFSENWLA